MTDYEKIEAGLLELGYRAERGKGDHMKFTKEGSRRPITISLGISGRSYQNAIANIRQVEPDFKLGKNVKSKSRQRADEVARGLKEMTDDDRSCAQRYKFICGGMEVRYTSPEKKDYSRLNDPSALMSHKFLVKELKTVSGRSYVTSPDDRVVILNTDLSQEMTVSPDDIDMWKTRVCPSCGRELPMNLFPFQRLGENPDGVCCLECSSESERLLTDFRALDGADEIDLDSIANGGPLFSQELHDELSKYGGIAISSLPISLQKRLVSEAKDVLCKMRETKGAAGRKTADKLERQLDTMTRGLTGDGPDNRKPSLYESWTDFQKLLLFNVERKLISDGVPKSERNVILKRIKSVSYSLGKVGDIQVLTVSTNHSDAFCEIFTQTRMIYSFLNASFDPDVLWTLKMRCPDMDFEQYFPSYRNARRVYGALRPALSTAAFTSQCLIASRMNEFPEYSEMGDVACGVMSQWMADNGFTDLSDRVEVFPDFFLHTDGNNDRETGTSGALLAGAYIKINDVGDGRAAEMYSKLRGDAEDVYQKILSGTGQETLKVVAVPFSALSKYEMGQMTSDEENEYLLHPVRLAEVEPAESVSVLLPSRLIDEVKRFAGNLDGGSSFDDALSAILDDWFAGMEDDDNDNDNTDVTNNTNNTNNMKTAENTDAMSNPLDSTNPSSPDKTLGEKTTRELLRELKNRGVKFGNVSVPVVISKEVSMDEI